ncbi:hypothetical protein CPC08DRAFT_730720 [Agrocybe pediades]|nr:hypothetical protein CPC08DRAFT_730720 [Agrocybe pediades]
MVSAVTCSSVPLRVLRPTLKLPSLLRKNALSRPFGPHHRIILREVIHYLDLDISSPLPGCGMDTTELPPELVHEILGWIKDQPSLLACKLVSPLFRDVAATLAFRFIVLRMTEDRHNLLPFDSFSTTVHVSNQVRKISFDFRSLDVDPSWDPSQLEDNTIEEKLQFKELWSLPNFPHLDTLSIYLPLDTDLLPLDETSKWRIYHPEHVQFQIKLLKYLGTIHTNRPFHILSLHLWRALRQ